MKIGVVGVGGWGKNHLRILSELGCLGSFCDIDEGKIGLYEARYGIRGYRDLDEMLDHETLDALVLATPAGTQYELAKRAMEKGLDLLIEKPFTGSYELGRVLVKMAMEKGILLLVGYIERFNPAVRELKEIVKSKRLGDPLLLSFRREHRMPPHIKDIGIIMDTAVHDIDTARWLIGDPEIVYARTGSVSGEREEFATIVMGYGDVKTAFLTSNWITPKRVRELIAVFTEGVVTLDFITQEIRIEEADRSIIPRRGWIEPLRLELEHFIECLKGEAEPVNSADECLNTSLIAELALRSAREGAPIEVKSLNRSRS